MRIVATCSEYAQAILELSSAFGGNPDKKQDIPVCRTALSQYDQFPGRRDAVCLSDKRIDLTPCKVTEDATFVQYEKVERQLKPSAGFDVFLLELLKRELNDRQSSFQKRRITQAKILYISYRFICL